MDKGSERRTEKRFRYHWPVWFAEDFSRTLNQGQMVDVTSQSAAFTCYDDGNCPCSGQCIMVRFSVPLYGRDDSFNVASFARSGVVCRVEDVNGFSKCVAVQFSQPLTFKPGEQSTAVCGSEATEPAVKV